ncbi:hypothetical protein EG68_05576 [Paragonimus skrjabini miyazakii]|uniref:Ankyrin repeat domain-containing protein n=1 Tax=Paragonimus skrjabini miyazakii TaxID=59628 RepID=A0A8S9Z5X2_9TREM|nr:hypothetical protein EG68_05576 [Paragonimus skrjabini miyazakii]
MCSIDSDWPLHYCSFHGLYGSLKEVLERNADVNKRDMYGMTALHIAVMLGHKDCAEMLLSHGACVTLKSLEGWNSLSEAISYGSLSLTTSLYCKLRRQFLDPEKIDEFQTTLSFIPDCQLTFDWEFITWMPFISKLLPSDTCCLRKIGQCLRLDTSVMDMNGLQWKRGDLSIVFNPKNRPALMLFNHKKRTYRSIGEKANLLNDVEVLRNTELLSMRLVADKMTWAPLTNRGIRRNRHRTEEKIGIFNVKHYIISNVVFRTVKRTEHLPESGRWIHRARRKSSVDSPRPSGTNREKSLSPPDGHKQPLGPGECNPANINWDQYKSGKLKPTQTYLGRKPEIKRTEKRLKLNITMTEEIPLTIPQ